MPKHRPIHFEDPALPDEMRSKVKLFIKHHPVASSAIKVVLAMAAVGGALTLAIVAPGIIGGLSKIAKASKREKRERYSRLWHSFYRLKKERMLEYVGERDGKMTYRLTKNGSIKLKHFLLETLEIKTSIKWDGGWRVVVFDIPEKLRKARRAIQAKLAELGFYPMQKSVWVHPFSCEEEVEFLKDFFRIKPFVDILLVKEMPNGRVIYHFKDLLKDKL